MNQLLKVCFSVFVLILVSIVPAFAQASSTPADEEAAYTRTINERADKIVETLSITDAAKATRVRDIIAGHYRNLRDAYDARDAQIKTVKDQTGDNKTAADAGVLAATNDAKLKIQAHHNEFIGRLLAELTPEQVDKVKDGLTYGVVPGTYKVYMEMLPNITDEQRRQIRAWLLEAREYAMDGNTSQEKHGWFGKYKGRINNYLAKAGIDMKKAEKEMFERQKAAAGAKK